MKRNKKRLFIVAGLLLSALLYCFIPTAASAVFGDIDGDGEISAVDARIILRVSASLQTLDKTHDEWGVFGDVNNDGEITAVDARLILRASAQLSELILPDTSTQTDSSSLTQSTGEKKSTRPTSTRPLTEFPTLPTSKPATTTTLPATTTIPLTEIVSIFNEAANELKDYKEKIDIENENIAYFKLEKFDIPFYLQPLFDLMFTEEDYNAIFMPNETSDTTELSFAEGKNIDPKSSIKSFAEALPRAEEKTLSELKSSALKSGTYVTDTQGNTQITLKLKTESGKSFDYAPVNHNSCMDTMFSVSNEYFGAMPMSDMKIEYHDAVIDAVINKDGKITYLKYVLPIKLEGKLDLGSLADPEKEPGLIGIKLGMGLTVKTTRIYNFTYPETEIETE